MDAEDSANFRTGRKFNVNLCDPTKHDHLENILSEHRPEVLFLDPWQSLITGYDENSAKDMGPALLFLERLIDEYKLTVFLDVHTGKDASRGVRGTSLLAGWRDNLFELDRNEKAGLVTVKVKPRSVANLDPFKLKFRNWMMCPSEGYPPQVQKIVDFVEANGGQATREQLREHMNLGSSEAFRKALERARGEKAV